MYKKYFKRIIDVIIAVLGLPFFIVLYIPISIFIKFEDRGPIIYCSKRIGKNGESFNMLKFRTMKVNAPDIRLIDGSTYNARNDPRVTKIGKYLRESSLDELPQILNVLKGDMSFIGPRPELYPIENNPESIKHILVIRPGLTGYNQVYYRNCSTSLEKIENDIYYIEHMSFCFDIKILLKTIKVVLKRENVYRE